MHESRKLLFTLSLVAGLAFSSCGDDDATGGEDASTPTDSGTTDALVTDATTETDAGETDASSQEDAAAACPDVSGSYDLVTVYNCGDASMNASQAIDLPLSGGACDVTFRSEGSKGAPAVNGSVTIDADGGFASTSLTIGTSTLTCTGAWNADESSMFIECTATKGTCEISLLRQPAD